MRVLFVNHTASLGGAELMLRDLVAGLAASGADAGAVLFEDGPLADRLRADGVAPRVLAAGAAVLGVRREDGPGAVLKAGGGVLRLVAALAREARGADVLFANSQKAFVVSALAGRLARRPVVWYLHDLLTPEHFGPTQVRLAVGLANRLAARVLCNSEATRDAFVAAGGDASRADVVYNGIDPAPFDAVTDLDRAAARASLGLPAGAPVVGVFSRIDTWKGQGVLLDALPDVPGVWALFVGGAPWGREALAADLRRQSDAVGVADRVVFAGFRDDVPALMGACTVVAHTSTAAEPFGRVIVEGMLAGRPVVATDAGGAREVVADGRTGWLVPPGDPAALARAVGQALDGGAEVDARTVAASREARRRFSPAAMVEGVARALRQAAARPSA